MDQRFEFFILDIKKENTRNTHDRQKSRIVEEFKINSECKIYKYSDSSEFKGKLEIGNKSAAESDIKFIYIAESYKNL
jgi:hypothetical protein